MTDNWNAPIEVKPGAVGERCQFVFSDEYTYPTGSDRDESRLLKPVSNSNQVMRAFLDEVAAIVCGPRQKDYDVPERNHARTAAIATVVLGVEMSAEKVCLFNLSQKMARLNHELTWDSLIDVAGYSANLAAIVKARIPVNGT